MRLSFLTIILAFGSSAWAADFSLAIGNAAAVTLADGTVRKDFSMAVRAENCADAAKAQITATAEGTFDGARRSVQVRLGPATTAGAFAVIHDWPRQGTWVVSLTGHCGSATASALVPIGPNGFLRESSKFFPRAATAAEVESVLKTMAGGAQ